MLILKSQPIVSKLMNIALCYTWINMNESDKSSACLTPTKLNVF